MLHMKKFAFLPLPLSAAFTTVSEASSICEATHLLLQAHFTSPEEAVFNLHLEILSSNSSYLSHIPGIDALSRKQTQAASLKKE
jgi:hypothetical protein